MTQTGLAQGSGQLTARVIRAPERVVLSPLLPQDLGPQPVPQPPCLHIPSVWGTVAPTQGAEAPREAPPEDSDAHKG